MTRKLIAEKINRFTILFENNVLCHAIVLYCGALRCEIDELAELTSMKPFFFFLPKVLCSYLLTFNFLEIPSYIDSV